MENNISIQENCLVLSLKMGRPGNKKKVSTALIETEADKDMLSVTKLIFDSPEYKKIKNLEQNISGWLSNTCLPSFFKKGFYLVPLSIFELVMENLKAFQKEREELIDEFISNYPYRIEEARDKLGSMFDASNYLPSESIKEKYYWEIKILNFSAPENLENISQALYEEEKKRVSDYWTMAKEQVDVALAESFKELITYMVDKLDCDEDGKPKSFRKTGIKKFEDFLESFNCRNIGENKELEKLIDQAKEIANGSLSAKDLREDQDLRTYVREGLEPIKNSIDQMLIDKPKRKIILEED
jgi:hypothetical protein